MKKFLALGLGVLALTLCFSCAPKDEEPYVPNPTPESGTEQNGDSQNGDSQNGDSQNGDSQSGGGSLDDNELPMVPFE